MSRNAIYFEDLLRDKLAYGPPLPGASATAPGLATHNPHVAYLFQSFPAPQNTFAASAYQAQGGLARESLNPSELAALEAFEASTLNRYSHVTLKLIKREWRRLALRLHPDRNPQLANAAQDFSAARSSFLHLENLLKQKTLGI